MPPEKIVVAATFTAGLLETPLAFWARQLGRAWELELAPHDQVFQQLLDGGSQLSQNGHGLDVVLIRLEDWCPGGEVERARLERHLVDLEGALRRSSQRTRVPHQLILCPASHRLDADPTRGPVLHALEERLATRLRADRCVEVVTSAELQRRHPIDHADDQRADELGRVPYRQPVFDALAMVMARRLHAATARPRKVLVLDCDQTLWRGVAGEDGPAGITLDPPSQLLQGYALDRRRAGQLLCLCSKNDEALVWRVFESHPEMPLAREDLVAWRIDWRPKSVMLRELAAELDLGLDSFVLIDDSALERAEVQAHCPEVLTLPVPTTAAALDGMLAHLWAFDSAAATDEDRRRSELYSEQAERQRLQLDSPDLESFIAGLELCVDLAPMGEADLDRVAQLTVRTSQMNFTGLRQTAAQLEARLDDPQTPVLVVRLRDRFGDYGLVGALFLRVTLFALEVDNLVLSCRALGRRVEDQLLAEVDRQATVHGLGEVRLELRPTARNRPARELIDALALPAGRDDRGLLIWQLGTGRLTRCLEQARSRRALEAPATVATVATASPTGPMVESGDGAASARLLERIATELAEPDALSAAIARQRPRLRRGTHGFTPPRTELERSLADLWAEILHIDRVGRDDNFFTAGGHSLLAMQMVLKLQEAFGVLGSLETVLSHPTLAGQAGWLEDTLIGASGPEGDAGTHAGCELAPRAELRGQS